MRFRELDKSTAELTELRGGLDDVIGERELLADIVLGGNAYRQLPNLYAGRKAINDILSETISE